MNLESECDSLRPAPPAIPFAPHLAEELWERLGHASSMAYEPWPAADPDYLVDEDFELVVQVRGKVRGQS